MMEEEKKPTVYYVRPPWRAFLGVIVGGLIAVGLLYYALFTYKLPGVLTLFKPYFYISPIGLLLLSLLMVVVTRYSRLYTIAPAEVSVRYGLLRRDIRTARYDKITDVRIEQSFVQRMLELGDIMCNTAGTPIYEIVLSDVYKPYFYLNIIKAGMSGKTYEN